MKKTILITVVAVCGFVLFVLASPPTTTDDTANYSPKITAANGTFSGVLTAARFSGNQGTVPTVVTNAGINGGATLSLDANASDTRFTITISTGGTTTTGSTNLTVTFGTAKTTTPYVMVAANTGASGGRMNTVYVTNVTTAGFCFASNTGVSLAATTTYIFTFFVLE